MKSSAESSAPAEWRLRPVPRAFFRRGAPAVAADLVGLGLEVRHGRERTLSRIVEVEAYPPGDPAAHTYVGKTERNRSMFLEGGHAYVYRSYGIHACFNVVAGQRDVGEGVLVRAAEPLEGLAFVAARRPGHPLRDWLRGPGRLCEGLGIRLADDGRSLFDGPIRIVELVGAAPVEVLVSPRIGISRAVDAPLRFFVEGSPFVSGPRKRNVAITSGPPRAPRGARDTLPRS